MSADARELWSDTALLAVERIAQRQTHLSSDDVWALLAEYGMQADEPRAMGAVMRLAARRGLIEPTAAYRPSRRRRGPQRVWRSLVKQ